jgi:hypothetical protein
MYGTAEHFYQIAYALWQSVGELFLPVDFVFRDMRNQLVIRNNNNNNNNNNYYYYYCCCCWKYPP